MKIFVQADVHMKNHWRHGHGRLQQFLRVLLGGLDSNLSLQVNLPDYRNKHIRLHLKNNRLIRAGNWKEEIPHNP